MLHLWEVNGEKSLKNPVYMELAVSANQLLRAFFAERPDCGTYFDAVALLAEGKRKLAAILDDDGALRGAIMLHNEGTVYFVDAYIGKLSIYVESGEAFEAYVRNHGGTAIETNTKPCYAIQTGRLGYDLKEFRWRKELLQ